MSWAMYFEKVFENLIIMVLDWWCLWIMFYYSKTLFFSQCHYTLLQLVDNLITKSHTFSSNLGCLWILSPIVRGEFWTIIRCIGSLQMPCILLFPCIRNFMNFFFTIGVLIAFVKKETIFLLFWIRVFRLSYEAPSFRKFSTFHLFYAWIWFF
jgi:hypothetical protein